MKKILLKSSKENKTRLAKKLGVSRGMLYYRHKRSVEDEKVKELILKVLDRHKAYGHKRIALELKLNKKRILRVMKKFNIKPYRKRKAPEKVEDRDKTQGRYRNLIKDFCPIRANVVWAGDFTWIEHEGEFYYLATVIDLFTREILGWSFSKNHDRKLVVEAFREAIKKAGVSPVYFHSDQGSEYESEYHLNLIESSGVTVSMSQKASPWENGYQESFYSNFKLELGDPNRFRDLGELVEAIAQAVYYYNHDRIHTKLKMSPVKFRLNHDRISRDYLFKELGT